jgi:signal transduction histidine kinase
MGFYLRYRYLIFAVVVLIFGKLTEWNALFPRFDNTYAQKFQKVFDNKERELQSYILNIEKALKTVKSQPEIQNKFSRFYGLMEKEGFGVFLYRNDSLVFWSDNSVVIGNRFTFSTGSNIYVYLSNAWFVTKIHEVGNWKIVGLIQIKQVFNYENRYLVNEFQRDFNFPSNVKISSRQVPDGYPIFNSNGMYIFSLVFDKTCQHPWFQLYIPVISYFACIVLLGFFFCSFLAGIQNFKLRRRLIFLVILIAVMIKYFSGQYHYPRIFYELDLFSPQNMAISRSIPSLGDLLLWAMLIFFISYLLFKNITYISFRIRKKVHRYLLLVFISAIISIGFILIDVLVKNMVLNSSISFEAHKVLLLNSYSFLGYIIFIMFFVSFGFFLDRLTYILSHFTNFKTYAVVFSLVSATGIITWFVISKSFAPLLYFFLMAPALLIGYFRIKKRSTYQFSGLIAIVLIFALYTADRVLELTLLKNRNETKILASNLSNQHDQVAEYIMEEYSTKILRDSVILGHLLSDAIDDGSLNSYISGTYFDGYFEKYNLQIIPCYMSDSLYLSPPDNINVHCREYFRETVNTSGTKLPSSSFYYIDNQNGRVSYLGWFEYFHPNLHDTITLFVELDSKVVTDELGYPELLLDKKMTQKSKFRDYSYAKYYDGTLISKFGYYPYDLSSKDFMPPNPHQVFYTKKLSGFNHLVYKGNNKDLIVISYPKVGFFEVLITFSWIFLFYLAITTIISVFTNLPLLQKAFKPDFKNKIQFAIMSVLFSSLIFIGGGTIIFSIRQYNNRHFETLQEKLRSLNVEVLQKIGRESRINPAWQSFPYSNLNELLMKFSNVFYADINLFDLSGNLVATSRPEIFEKGLIGYKINPSAFNELAINKRSQYIHDEKIGAMNYLSGYVPLLNHENRLIAYLNIPYFVRQEELTYEVSNLVVGIVNVYVILLLVSLLISIIISRRITIPLRMIQKKFSEINLVQNYDRIEYEADDEIGGLVKEYNRMVKELDMSIERLAKSERESAWREMARQIAHEINNPLTPMKLSVQHLLRAHNDKSEKFDEYLERISKTLIEEIDNLSSIATEFSNFAKMPQAHNLRFNLIDKINTVVNLFSNSEADFILNFNNFTDVDIFADKEQVSRVFINLFKNAIQAVEKGTQPVIKIELSLVSDKAVVRVSDNGNGIPEALRDKLFRPNFTTKSSGMGLGLAIIKNIMEDIGGAIRFTTQTGKGTSFILEFPVYRDKKLVW